jgi:Icc-related predicted phosphoesterase
MEAIRVAGAGDLHCSELNRDHVAEAFAQVEHEADLILLAGDLTTHGEPEQAAVLADAVRAISTPVLAVLGNHDLHSGRGEEIAEIVTDGGVILLDRASHVCEFGGRLVGVAGTKGFVGGFPGSTLPDFGEPLLRRVYAETGEEVEALERGLQEIAHCHVRIVLLHYAPTSDTLHGEPEGIWTYLGSQRLAAPIAEFRPDLALHGHAHAGAFEGAIGDVPVYNVAIHVTGKDFWIFELDPTRRDATPVA